MHGLLTFTTFGTWLPGPARGWIDPGAAWCDEPWPEPDEAISARRRRALKWPAVCLDGLGRAAIRADLPRIARLREFTLHLGIVAPDHVHLAIELNVDPDIPRRVQLIKGALSRALSVAGGDVTARSSTGSPLAHHKWWTRQYSFLVDDALPSRANRWAALRNAHAREDIDILG